MKYPFFASFIVFCLWLTYEIHKHRRLQEKARESFWERERQANNTRRKSLDDLNYITIPLERLPMDLLPDDPKAAELTERILSLSKEPIVNFTGISNTDLKLQYGAPNIDLLTLYDQRYTTLAGTLQSWASYLYEKGYVEACKNILIFAVETGTDVSGSYKLLARIYQAEGNTDGIRELIPIAEGLNSAMSAPIVKALKEYLP